jgi:predicted acetyltransferase
LPDSTALLRPAARELPAYVAALERGWSPDNILPEETRLAQLAAIREDPAAFLALQDDREGRGPPVPLPDGSTVPRLPSLRRWIVDGEGEFCGSIGLRWTRDGSPLPPHVMGHVGYAVVPWRRGRGHATRALALLLPVARSLGLPHVDLTTDPDNVPSQRVILANGGEELDRFTKPAALGSAEGLRFRIRL